MSGQTAKWNLIVDIANCTNCAVCIMASKDEHVGNDFPGYAAATPRRGPGLIRVDEYARGEGNIVDTAFLPVMCQHCDDAPCMKVSSNGAVTKRSDGIILIDPEKTKGQRQIVDACPYDAVIWNEEKQIPQIWIFDAHLLDQGWKVPRAVQSCATSAILAVKLTDQDMARRAEAEGLERLRPDRSDKTRVWYRNLQRVRNPLVGGTVIGRKDGIVDCVAGAKVIAKCDGGIVATTDTDVFGQFRIDSIKTADRTVTMEIEAPGHARATLEFQSGKSVNLGEIELR